MIPLFGRNAEIKVKVYRSNRDYEKDANALFKRGYVPVNVTMEPGTVLVGHTLVKWVTLFGALTGPTRTKPKITVTYRRTSATPYFYPSTVSA